MQQKTRTTIFHFILHKSQKKIVLQVFFYIAYTRKKEYVQLDSINEKIYKLLLSSPLFMPSKLLSATCLYYYNALSWMESIIWYGNFRRVTKLKSNLLSDVLNDAKIHLFLVEDTIAIICKAQITKLDLVLSTFKCREHSVMFFQWVLSNLPKTFLYLKLKWNE